MNRVSKMSIFLPVVLLALFAATSVAQASNTELKHEREQAVQQLGQFAKLVKPTAERIVNNASNYAPEIVYQANVLHFPKRASNRRKHTSHFVAFSIRSEKAVADLLCLRAANKNYWCKIQPRIAAAKSRPIRGLRKNDLAKLVILAMHSRYEVEPLSSSKIEELAPQLASELKNIRRQSNIDMNVRGLTKLYAAYIYSLRSFENPLEIYLFEPSIDMPLFLAVKKIRGSRRFYRAAYKTILSQL